MEDLIKLKKTHNKVKHIEFKDYEMQEYLKSALLSNNEAKFLFHSRCRMLPVRTNYGGSFSDNLCPLCKKIEDSQSHLLLCDSLVNQNILATSLPDYDHLFSSKVEDQVVIVKVLKKQLGERKKLLKN